MQDHRSKQAGFSLVELLVAIVILAVGLLGLAELQISAMRSNSKSGSIVAATSVAQMAVEEIMAVSSVTDTLYPLLTSGQASYTDWPLGASETFSGFGDYTIQYRTTLNYPPGSVAPNNVTLVEIRVMPQAGAGTAGKPVDVAVMKDLRRIYD